MIMKITVLIFFLMSCNVYANKYVDLCNAYGDIAEKSVLNRQTGATFENQKQQYSKIVANAIDLSNNEEWKSINLNFLNSILSTTYSKTLSSGNFSQSIVAISHKENTKNLCNQKMIAYENTLKNNLDANKISKSRIKYIHKSIRHSDNTVSYRVDCSNGKTGLVVKTINSPIIQITNQHGKITNDVVTLNNAFQTVCN